MAMNLKLARFTSRQPGSLPGESAELRAARRAVNLVLRWAGNTFRASTLPSGVEGLRVLPGSQEDALARAMQGWAAEFEQARDSLLAEYARALACSASAAWPSLGVVRSRFDYRFEILPCPADPAWATWVRDVTRVAAAAAAAGLAEWLRRMARQSRTCGVRAITPPTVQAWVAIAADAEAVPADLLAEARTLAALPLDTIRQSDEVAARAERLASQVVPV